MRTPTIIAVTALAPAIWGSTFVVTTELLPPDHALTNACLRALPAGLVLLAVTRQLPRPSWIGKLVIVSALNFSIFWWLLFEAAYRLPGGVAATVGSVQPLIVFALSAWLLKTRVSILVYVAGIGGIIGVALLALTPEAAVDPTGVAAAIAGAFSMALGVVLTKRWQFPVSPLTFASWQLVIGGLLLAPAAILIDPPMPTINVAHLAGYAYLALIGGAVTYTIWFWGIAQLGPVTPTTLGFFSPVSALFLGWIILGQSMTSLQLSGVGLIVVSVAVGVWIQRTFITQRVQGICTESRRVDKPWLGDPCTHPDIKRMSMRENLDLPVDRVRVRDELRGASSIDSH